MESGKQNSVYIWGLFNSKEFTTPFRIKELEHKDIVHVASGGHFYLALSADGNLFGWGTTKYNRFGISGEDLTIPRHIPLKVQAKSIASGNWHSMLIDSNGRLYSVGHNKQGACGTGSFSNVETYSQVQTPIAAKYIACGDCYSLIISIDNELYSCGHADLHGHKQKEHLNKPKKLNFDGETVRTVAAGFTHSLAVTHRGQVFSWGQGNFYQLGHGGKQNEKEPRLIKKLADIRVTKVSCTRGEKNAHSMAVSEDGSVYTWGAGYKGKLGHQKTWSHENQADEHEPRKMKTVECKVVNVAAGGIHSNILSAEGQVLSFGCGSNGRLGHSQSKEYVYLYREGVPKALDQLKSVSISQVHSSYYHNICLGAPRS